MTAPLWADWFTPSPVASYRTGVAPLTTAWDRKDWAHGDVATGSAERLNDWFESDTDEPSTLAMSGRRAGSADPPSLVAVPEWMDDAACVGSEIDMLQGRGWGSIEKRKAVCANCTVRAECLGFAVDTETTYGVWGGLDGSELRALVNAKGGGVCYVAIVGCEIKVGYTTKLKNWMRGIRDEAGATPHVLATISGSYALELELHKALAAFRAHGEYYRNEAPVFSILSSFGFDFGERAAA